MVHHVHDPHADSSVPDIHQDTYSKTVLGFWLYLMTDCILFTSLFATYAILHNATFGGPSSSDLFDLSTAISETLILLLSTVVCGFAMIAAVRSDKKQVLIWLGITFLLGAAFLSMELNEFNEFIREGNSWTRSAFLTSFFTLVGTHGLHISVGLLWIAIMMAQVYFDGITIFTFRRLVLFSMFWHFLDLVWIFIFTFVYLMGVKL